MSVNKQELEKIASYYDGLDKEAAFGLLSVGIPLMTRLAPHVFKLANKVPFLRPLLASGARAAKHVGARIASTGNFGKGLVEGLKGSSINPYAVKKTMGGAGLQALKGVASKGRAGAIGITKGDMNARLWGRRLGHFANVNTWTPYNKGFLVDAPLYSAIANQILGGNGTNSGTLDPAEYGYTGNYSSPYDTYGR